MRRITMWLTATAIVVTLAIAYQLSLSGTGKAGEHDAPPAAAGEAAAPRTEDGKTGGTPNVHEDKDGETK